MGVEVKMTMKMGNGGFNNIMISSGWSTVQRRAALESGGALFQRTPRHAGSAHPPPVLPSASGVEGNIETNPRDLVPQTVEVKVTGADAVLRPGRDRGLHIQTPDGARER